MMFGMARTPSIADLLDDAASNEVTFKLDEYLATLEPDVRDRVLVHLKSKDEKGKWKMPSRRIALTISNDPSTSFTISPSAVDTWRHHYCKPSNEAAGEES